ncbi:MAG: TonB-dependent receptor [Marinilabiliaceae bacterium]
MRFLFLLAILCFPAGLLPVASQPDCFKGQVIDASTGQFVPNVHVWEINQSDGAVTDSTGYFELCGIEKDHAVLMFSHTSYNPVTITVDPDQSFVEARLEEKVFTADEVKITGDRAVGRDRIMPGGDRIDALDVFRLPSFLGQPDVVDALKQMPGVQTVSEGVGGIYVRGGGAGQNRIWLDGMELMNPYHLMGVYSAFNPLTTTGVEIYKGHTPVSLNSGLSSAIEVSSRAPLENDDQIQASLGNIASNLAFSQSSENDRLGITAGIRRSYLELYKDAASRVLPEDENYFAKTDYHFLDFNGRIDYRAGSSSLLSLSWYWGLDDFAIADEDLGYDARTTFGNRSLMLQWKTQPDPWTSLYVGIGHTSSWSGFNGDIVENDIDFESRHQRSYLHSKFSRENEDHLLRTGIEAYYYNTVPREMILMMDRDKSVFFDRFRNAELSWFLEDTYRISRKLKVYAGLRGHYYMTLGPYDYHGERTQVRAEKNEVADDRFLWSPSVSFSFHPSTSAGYKLAWSGNVQTGHLASLSSMPLPNDIWMMSSPRLLPQKGHQLSLEFSRELPLVTLKSGFFWRTMEHQTIFNVRLDRADENFEDQFYRGEGRAYGLEFSARKERGNLQGGVHYTWSRSKRSFSEIFEGDWFRDKFDRPHDLSASIHYDLNEKWDIGGRWIYASGSNMTLPSGRMWMMGTIMNDYEGFNNFRLPPYHRLDLTAMLTMKSDLFKESVLNFSLINVYNRANPYFIYYKVYQGDSRYDIDIRAAQVSLFPIMPSVSWQIKF